MRQSGLDKIALALGFIAIVTAAYFVLSGRPVAYHGMTAAGWGLVAFWPLGKEKRTKADWWFFGLCILNVVVHGIEYFARG